VHVRCCECANSSALATAVAHLNGHYSCYCFIMVCGRLGDRRLGDTPWTFGDTFGRQMWHRLYLPKYGVVSHV